MLVKWRNSVPGGNKFWWDSLILTNKKKNQSFPDKIIFEIPIFATKVRIKMKGPVNKFFALYKVAFFTKNNLVIIKKKQNQIEKCNEYCWVANSVQPEVGDEIRRKYLFLFN